uniref:MATE efflux family protein n=1 Tax=Steinernema glaseri TaxID=37863 RepID=A0A1I7ZQV4_9BILA
MTAHISIGKYIGPYGVIGAAVAFTIETLVYYSMAHISIGSYIGPYGVLGASLSVTIETVVYYSMLRKQKKGVVVWTTST